MPPARSTRNNPCHHRKAERTEGTLGWGQSRALGRPHGETRDTAAIHLGPGLLGRFTEPRRILSPLAALHSLGSAPATALGHTRSDGPLLSQTVPSSDRPLPLNPRQTVRAASPHSQPRPPLPGAPSPPHAPHCQYRGNQASPCGVWICFLFNVRHSRLHNPRNVAGETGALFSDN